MINLFTVVSILAFFLQFKQSILLMFFSFLRCIKLEIFADKQSMLVRVEHLCRALATRCDRPKDLRSTVLETNAFPLDQLALSFTKTCINIQRSCSSSSSVRFSRSFSDISRELLSHAANMVASSSTDDVTNDDDNYSNPFATLKVRTSSN